MKKKSIDHTQLLLLKLLACEDMYGYQIILELARRSSNVFEMKEAPRPRWAVCSSRVATK